ncbi:MAG: anaerobic ribonucleoside-triphosphate reductase activating protein [Spirochaetaceae bacterium]
MRLGLQKTTLVDYPGHLAATLFTHGCPLRCPFCHNPELVGGEEPREFIDELEVLSFLEKRAHLLEGVCITGGEPLLHPELPRLVRRIRRLGLKIKLDTSGAYPSRLAGLLEAGFLDYVALDVKTTPDRYDQLRGSGEKLLESVAALRESGIPYELRATAVPGFVDEEYARWLGDFLASGETFYLQQYQPGTTLDPSYRQKSPYSEETLRSLATLIGKKKRHAKLRGV